MSRRMTCGAVELDNKATRGKLYVTDMTVRETFPNLPLTKGVCGMPSRELDTDFRRLWPGSHAIKDMLHCDH
jgi:hypothetical protein